MIKITKRQKDIIQYLLDSNGFVTVKNLSERFNVSQRTFRYELDTIEYFLKSYEIEIERKPHYGIKLEVNDRKHKLLLDDLRCEDDYHLQIDERRRLILFYLLCERLTTIEVLAEILNVSKQTIQSDLEELDKELSDTELRIVRKVRKGCFIEGKEKDIRIYFSQLYLKTSDIEKSIIDKYIVDKCQIISGQAKQIVSNMEKFQKFNFAHPNELRSFVAFNLFRTSQGNTLTDIDTNKFEEGRLSLIEKLTNNFELNIDENDALFILERMLDAKVDSIPQATIQEDEDERIASELADFLLEGLSSSSKLNEEESLVFTENLRLHLKITLFRIRNKLNVENQILDRVKVSIPLIYEYTKNRLIDFESKSGLYFNEEEIAYIAMHIGAIVEKRTLYSPGLNVLVVCHFGIATSKIMVSRLNVMIPEISIIGPLTIEEAKNELSRNKIDLIITTIKFDSVIDTIQVSPLLSDEDIYRIKSKAYKNTYLKQCNKFIKNFNTNSKVDYSLSDFLSDKHIQIRESIPEWRDAIRLAAQPLLEDQFIEKRYVERMIRAVEEFGNYMVILPEIAFVHAGIDDGVNQQCVSMLILKNPVVFGNKHQELIRNIVVIAVKKREDDMILKLAKILENPENRNKLYQDNITVSEILNLKYEVTL